ncbi:MAG TPA: hypothetical protein PL070_20980, partial [Flavobacteriales bacterium]|nr:hypothetical protein [Flavobacteriales bacterium]
YTQPRFRCFGTRSPEWPPEIAVKRRKHLSAYLTITGSATATACESHVLQAFPEGAGSEVMDWNMTGDGLEHDLEHDQF